MRPHPRGRGQAIRSARRRKAPRWSAPRRAAATRPSVRSSCGGCAKVIWPAWRKAWPAARWSSWPSACWDGRAPGCVSCWRARRPRASGSACTRRRPRIGRLPLPASGWRPRRHRHPLGGPSRRHRPVAVRRRGTTGGGSGSGRSGTTTTATHCRGSRKPCTQSRMRKARMGCLSCKVCTGCRPAQAGPQVMTCAGPGHGFRRPLGGALQPRAPGRPSLPPRRRSGRRALWRNPSRRCRPPPRIDRTPHPPQPPRHRFRPCTGLTRPRRRPRNARAGPRRLADSRR